MTQLPATFIEEEAIATASQWVDTVREKLSAEASREWLESNLHEFLKQGLIPTMQVIDSARAGDPIAHAALWRVATEMLDRGEMPGAALRTYYAEATRPGPPHGKYWADDWRRNAGIAVLVFMTKEHFGLRPTRNRASKRKPSACSVVAAALGRAGINVAEKRIENIWAGLAGKIVTFAASRKMSPFELP